MKRTILTIIAAALLPLCASAQSLGSLLGKVADAAQLKKLEKVLKKDAFEVVVDLHLGNGESSVYTCDLSLDYVHINADYTT